MKTTLISCFILISTLVSGQINKLVFDETKNETILCGECNRNGFALPEFAHWFDKEYDHYKVNDTLFVAEYNLQFDSVYIFLATWCEDSHREVPRFCKIMSHQYFAGTPVKFFCLDGNKKTDAINTDDYYVQYVPTFIFYYDGNELCRIIESPRTGSLEEDIMDLLSRIQE